MNKIKMLSVLVLSAISFSSSAIEVKAPFGFNWGDSKSELEAKGVKFSSCSLVSEMEACTTTKAIKNISFSDSFLLAIDTNEGLQKVIMYGEDITSDSYGTNGREKYNQVKSSINKKYGNAEKEYELIGGSLYKEDDEFYQCLAYEGCGFWTSFWMGSDKNNGTIQLSIEGKGRGKGALKVMYESKYFEKLMEKSNAIKNNSDSDAF